MKKTEEMNTTNELIEAVKSKKTFAELGVNEQLVKSVTELGYTHATLISVVILAWSYLLWRIELNASEIQKMKERD